MWLATAVAAVYLVAVWRPRVLLLTPLILIVVWFVSPRSVRERLVSIYKPHGQVDSNVHRYVTMRTGLAMIKAHPIFGIGPEMPGKQFQQYVPADIARPLPHWILWTPPQRLFAICGRARDTGAPSISIDDWSHPSRLLAPTPDRRSIYSGEPSCTARSLLCWLSL